MLERAPRGTALTFHTAFRMFDAKTGNLIVIGALSIGALSIGAVGIGRTRIRKVRIDELEVGRLTVLNQEES